MLLLFLKFMLQRIAHARAHARLLGEKHPSLTRRCGIVVLINHFFLWSDFL